MRSSRPGQYVRRIPSSRAAARYGNTVPVSQLDRGGNCQRHVALLVPADQWRIDRDRRAKRLHDIRTLRSAVGRYGTALALRTPSSAATLTQNLVGLGMLRQSNHCSATPQNSRLFAA